MVFEITIFTQIQRSSVATSNGLKISTRFYLEVFVFYLKVRSKVQVWLSSIFSLGKLVALFIAVVY
jgi:hypothetical protein